MGTSALRAQLHLFGYHAGTPSPPLQGQWKWPRHRVVGDPRSCRNFVGGRRATPPSRAEQATGIDRPIDMWPVLSDLLNVMTAELPPNRLKSQLGDQPAFNSTAPVPSGRSGPMRSNAIPVHANQKIYSASWRQPGRSQFLRGGPTNYSVASRRSKAKRIHASRSV